MKRRYPPGVLMEDPPLTGEDIYRMAESSAVVRRCIPENLVASLPRLEIIAGILCLQTWYFRPDWTARTGHWRPLFYLAQSVWLDEVVELKAFTDQTGFPPVETTRFHRLMFGEQTAYLDRVAELINQEAMVSDEQLEVIQTLWEDYQLTAAVAFLKRRPEVPRFLCRALMQPHLTVDPELLLREYL